MGVIKPQRAANDKAEDLIQVRLNPIFCATFVDDTLMRDCTTAQRKVVFAK
ncbi:MAG: hypothetical protein WCK93_03445 [Nitrosomonadales bacterium]|jgi:hypothetical protein